MDGQMSPLLLLFLSHVLLVHGEGLDMMPIELAPIPCNDKAVEKLTRLAVTYINEDRAEGYKFALNRIANVHLHAQGPAGNVYYLDLDVLETKCHIGSPKPWKRCDVRPFMETQISGNCNTTILHTQEGYSYLYSYDCTLVPDAPEKLQQTCPTCPLLLPVDSPQAVAAAHVTLESYKRKSLLGAGLGVKRILRAAEQTRPVKASFVEYTVQQCPEGTTEAGTCQRLTAASDTETTGFCSGSVQDDVSLHPEVHVSCEMFKVQTVDVLTPLRPQVHDLTPKFPIFPSDVPFIIDPEPPVAVEPTFAPILDPVPVDPVPVDPVPVDPAPPAPAPPAPPTPRVVLPSDPLTSSSSESYETLAYRPPALARPAPPAGPSYMFSSSEEMGAPLALRPPHNFWYKRRDDRRRRRQALPMTTTHSPVFLTDFPDGASPFRSCPGPSRYTTV
ncbi:alpha-2-HS-glycoprotein [Eucyclogobius newberryi]|uniref:alpha-2-HS-glycoprotein n=1 Tax=Eucyclogobius newberryi TaxID=166745 RepID=UPI003B5A7D3F